MFDWGRGSKSARRFESVPKDVNEPGGISNIQTRQENGNRQLANARVHYSPPAVSAQSDNHSRHAFAQSVCGAHHKSGAACG